MSVSNQINEFNNKIKEKYNQLLQSLDELELSGHTVEVKTNSVVLIDSKLLVYLDQHTYHLLPKNERESLDGKDLNELLKDETS